MATGVYPGPPDGLAPPPGLYPPLLPPLLPPPEEAPGTGGRVGGGEPCRAEPDGQSMLFIVAECELPSLSICETIWTIWSWA